jgi:hypothetical protein
MGAGTSVISSHGFSTLASSTQGGIDQLKAYPSDKDAVALSIRYNTLLTTINKSIKDIDSASVNVIAAQQSSYNSQLDDLNTEKNEIITRINGVTSGYIIRQVSYALGMLFAVIIITNKMVGEKWQFLMLYALWGAILYPFVLLYGLYDPPAWRALLIPIFELPSKEWYVRFMIPFQYQSEGKVIAAGGKKNTLTLTVFTGIVFAIWVVGQSIK